MSGRNLMESSVSLATAVTTPPPFVVVSQQSTCGREWQIEEKKFNEHGDTNSVTKESMSSTDDSGITGENPRTRKLGS